DEPDPDQVEAAANEFRYERDLLTAAETEAWLARWGLTTDDWMESIQRSVLRREWAPELAEIVEAHPVAEEEIADATGPEGICSGHFARFARKLAGRAAAYDRMREEAAAEGPPEGSDAQVARAAAAAAAEVGSRGLPGIPAPVCREKLAALARLEQVFSRFRERALTPAAIRDAVGARRLDWVRLHCRTAAFPDEQKAREAALCVREDGVGLGEAARAAKGAVRESRFFLDEADPESRHAFLGAAKGDLVGPLPVDGGFALYHVLEKVLPAPEDPAIRPRAEREALERAVDREINDRVRWRTAP
ncbi:MAG TPA: hypothetical protein VIG69_06475, partial [Candidatus Methylomirabilis sp.]